MHIIMHHGSSTKIPKSYLFQFGTTTLIIAILLTSSGKGSDFLLCAYLKLSDLKI